MVISVEEAKRNKEKLLEAKFKELSSDIDGWLQDGLRVIELDLDRRLKLTKPCQRPTPELLKIFDSFLDKYREKGWEVSLETSSWSVWIPKDWVRVTFKDEPTPVKTEEQTESVSGGLFSRAGSKIDSLTVLQRFHCFFLLTFFLLCLGYFGIPFSLILTAFLYLLTRDTVN